MNSCKQMQLSFNGSFDNNTKKHLTHTRKLIHISIRSKESHIHYDVHTEHVPELLVLEPVLAGCASVFADECSGGESSGTQFSTHHWG